MMYKAFTFLLSLGRNYSRSCFNLKKEKKKKRHKTVMRGNKHQKDWYFKNKLSTKSQNRRRDNKRNHTLVADFLLDLPIFLDNLFREEKSKERLYKTLDFQIFCRVLRVVKMRCSKSVYLYACRVWEAVCLGFSSARQCILSCGGVPGLFNLHRLISWLLTWLMARIWKVFNFLKWVILGLLIHGLGNKWACDPRFLTIISYKLRTGFMQPL